MLLLHDQWVGIGAGRTRPGTGATKLDFTGTGIGFSQLFLQSANGNTQVKYGGSAILVFGVASLTAADFLF